MKIVVKVLRMVVINILGSGILKCGGSYASDQYQSIFSGSAANFHMKISKSYFFSKLFEI